MPESEEKQQNLEWLVKNRSRNQRAALTLRQLLIRHDKRWRAKEHSVAAQELISVCFSLWRAAFLADKTGKRSAVFAHASIFLDKMIEDNSISYANDKYSREWTFNYYTRAARFSLEYLEKRCPDVVPRYKVLAKRRPKERWEYCQKLFEDTLAAFDSKFSDFETAIAASKEKRERKAQTKNNRAVVRKMQLASRKS